VERISWLSAIQYCNMRSMREGLKPCYNTETFECDFNADGYRLPTEAEWEYACRAGTTGRWSCGDDPAQLTKHAWLKPNANKTTQPVKQKSANPWGLYDMHGNVVEWVTDWFDKDYYAVSPAEDPTGPATGTQRVLRGGSWFHHPDGCRCTDRTRANPGIHSQYFGFRVVCVPQVPGTPQVEARGQGA
jgi:formylglycine-generating enzyme required for sulfatase activity